MNETRITTQLGENQIATVADAMVAKEAVDKGLLMTGHWKKIGLTIDQRNDLATETINLIFDLGEWLDSAPMSIAGRPKKLGARRPISGPTSRRAAAREIGVPWTTARMYMLAVNTLSRDDLDAYITEVVDAKDELTWAGVFKLAKKLDKNKKLEEARRAAAESVTDSPEPPILYICDSLDYMQEVEPASVDLLLTDPPYSTDVDDIDVFVGNWLPLALSLIKPTGRAYIFTGSYPGEIKAYLDIMLAQAGAVRLDDLMVWTYRNTMGPAPRRGYKRNWQAIWYLVGDEAADLNCPILKERFSVQDVNPSDEHGARLQHTWAKPDEIARRFILHGSQPGDLVFDPFACTGVFLATAAKLGRRAFGCEIDESNAAIAEGKGCSCERW